MPALKKYKESIQKPNIFFVYLSWFVLVCIFLMVLEYWQSIRIPKAVFPYVVFSSFLICTFRVQTLPGVSKIVILIMLICIVPILRLSFIGTFRFYPKDYFYFWGERYRVVKYLFLFLLLAICFILQPIRIKYTKKLRYNLGVIIAAIGLAFFLHEIRAPFNRKMIAVFANHAYTIFPFDVFLLFNWVYIFFAILLPATQIMTICIKLFYKNVPGTFLRFTK
jgi:hypothetical protein